VKAMVLREFRAPLRAEERDLGTPGPDEALVRVRACGVCGTDVKIWEGAIPAPIITLPHVPGHEVAGEVVEVGSAVADLAAGDRVIVYLYISCGDCAACRSSRENLCPRLRRVGFEEPGGFAEYLLVPARQLVPISPGIAFEQAAVVTDAVLVPYHALRRQAAAGVGDTVLVMGIGGLGIHAVQVARAAGCRVIAADIDAARLELARELGAEEALLVAEGEGHLERVRELTEGWGVDVVLENVGSAASVVWSLPALRKGGRMVIVGYVPGSPFAVDSMAMHYHEWELVGSRLGTKQDFVEALSLVERGLVRPWVTATFALDEVNEALARLSRGEVLGRAALVI
jgi:2-desacetyl-2-hydroxyethyl bacteriochlorophyllide A dehydrogenase